MEPRSADLPGRVFSESQKFVVGFDSATVGIHVYLLGRRQKDARTLFEKSHVILWDIATITKHTHLSADRVACATRYSNNPSLLAGDSRPMRVSISTLCKQSSSRIASFAKWLEFSRQRTQTFSLFSYQLITLSDRMSN
jgi:uncharacterized membrane protein